MDRKKNWKSELVLRGRQDPAWWIESVLGGSLWEKQKEICEALVKHERVAVAGAFGFGKCVAFGERIILSNGSVAKAEDLIGKSFKVLAWDEKTGQQIEADAFAEDNGLKPVCKITTKSGRCIIRTENHPLYTGYLPKRNVHRIPTLPRWRPINNLRGNMVVAVPLKLNVLATKTITEDEAKLIGYLLGDGGTTTGLMFTQKLGRTLDDFREIVNRFNCDLSKISAMQYDYRIVGRERTEDNINRYNPLLEKFRAWGLTGHKAKHKYLPDFIWELNDSLLALIMNRLFACDGWVYIPKTARESSRIAITLASEKLIRDIELVMLRLGIYGNVSYGQKTCNGKKFDAWTWQVFKGVEVLKFIDRVGIFGKENKLEKCRQFVLTKTSFKHTLEWPFKSLPEGYAWEQIRSIEYLGLQPTVGICVPEYKTYLTTFVEHNTHLAARLMLWFLLCHPNSKVVSTAPTQRQVKDLLWSELRAAHTKAIMPLGGELLQLQYKLGEDHFAVGFSTDSENIDRFTGYHAPHQLVVFDQAGGIDSPIWEAAEGLMTSANCRWLAISNTAISSCELANICMPDRKTKFGDWHVIRVKATETPNVLAGRNIYPGLIAHDWVKKREEAWGRDDPLYKIFVEAEFIPDSEMVVVPYKAIVDAFNTNGELGSHIEVGLDVARMGTDSTVWTAVSGSRVMEVKRVTGNTTMQVVGLTVEFVKHLQETYGLPVTAVKIDVIGLGAGVYDRLIELDDDNIEIPVVAVNNAEVNIVVDKERYSNVRAEMAWAFRHRIDHGNVGLAAVQVHDYEIKEYIRGDIQAMRYKITSQGKIQLLPKEELKKNLGRSPDYWDSLVMAFETPGGGPPMLESISSKKEREEEFSISEEEWQILMGTRMPMDGRFFRDVQF